LTENPFDLTGKVALVTGSTQGIGNGMAVALARAGAKVGINGRDPEKTEKAAARLRETGLSADACPFDATSAASIDAGISAFEGRVGEVDILVNNAGHNIQGALASYPIEDFHRLMALNLDAVLLVSQRVVPAMIDRGRGKIIITASLSADFARPGGGTYATSKAAVRMLGKAMAVEWGPHNIQVNVISPGWNRTEIMERILATKPELESWVSNRTPLGRWSDPARDLGGAVVFFASAASDFVTGQALSVDGGFAATF
jgi:gluconate 5-dehydrogenase